MNINAGPGVIPQKGSVAQALACCLVKLLTPRESPVFGFSCNNAIAAIASETRQVE